MTIDGYEDYVVMGLSSYFFNSSYANDLFTSVREPRGTRSTKVTYRIPGTEPIWKKIDFFGNRDTLKQDEVFTSKLCTPEQGQTLYYDPACTIPRIKCEGTWKRTIKLTNADIVVVPEPCILDSMDVALFLHEPTKSIYLMNYPSQVKMPFQAGDTLADLLMVNYATLSNKYKSDPYYRVICDSKADMVCIYKGAILKVADKQRYMLNIIDGLYPRIVYEKDLMNMLGTEEESFDTPLIEGILELLRSQDADSVHHGMRVLASMDYTHYPSITKYILGETLHNWEKHKPFNSAVKFMLDSLGYRRNASFHNAFISITPEEFALAQPMFEDIIKSEVAQCMERLQRQTNMKLSYTFSVEAELPEPAAPATEECPDCPDPDEVDFSFINN